MIGALLKRVARVSASSGGGKALSGIASLATKEGRSQAFASTSAGRLMSGITSNKQNKTSSKKANAVGGAAADAAGGSAAYGLRISKQTLMVLESIDENLKRMVDVLGLQSQKEEAAKEEAATEARAPTPTGQESPQAEKPGFFKRFGKGLSGLTFAIIQVAMPLYEMVKAAVQWLMDMGMKALDFLGEKLLKLFTEDVPHFFIETVPDFFMNTLPEIFFGGVDFLKGKMDGILKSIGDILTNLKKNVGGLIVNLADSAAAKFLLPDSLRNNIKALGQDMQKSTQASTLVIEKVEAQGVPADTSKEKSKADLAAVPLSMPSPLGTAASAPGAMSLNAPRGQGSSGGVGGAVGGSAGVAGGIGSPASATPSTAGGMGGAASVASMEPGGTAEGSGTVPSPAGGTGGGMADAISNSGGTGGAVASASMAATAPEAPVSSVTPSGSTAKNMSKLKANPDPVNNIANVPDVFPSLGSIADLWYHNSSALTPV